jgi:hypothetical protein
MAAADPVIIDDGGSTRLKRVVSRGAGEMNGLLDVDPSATPPQSSETLPGPYSHIRVVTLDKDGAGGANPVLDSALTANDTFTITSANGQITVGTFDNALNLTISLQGTATNVPLVEARQFDRKRRYEVMNAGKITNVSATLNTINQSHDVPKPNIYTAVLLS